MESNPQYEPAKDEAEEDDDPFSKMVLENQQLNESA